MALTTAMMKGTHWGTKNYRVARKAFMTLCLSVAVFSFVPAGTAFAACSNPAGSEGDIIYNQDFKMMQFCNNTSWIAMGQSALTESDPEVGDVSTSGNICVADGTSVQCTLQNLLNSLGNVSVAAPNDADVLKFDSASQTWVAAAAGGATPAGADRQIQFNSGGNFAGSSKLVFTSTDRLGIGTSSPGRELHVKGGILARTSFGSIELQSDAGYPSVRLDNGGTGGRISFAPATSGGYDVNIFRNSGSALRTNDNLIVDKALSVNTASTPVTALDVGGTLKMAYGSEACDASHEGAIHYDSSTDKFMACATSGSWTDMLAGGGTPAGADRQIQFNSGNTMAADANFVYTSVGRLGIGTSTPDSLLSIEGDVPTMSFNDTGSNSSSTISFLNDGVVEAKIRAGSGSGSAGLLELTTSDTTETIVLKPGNSNDYKFQIGNDAAGDYIFAVPNGETRDVVFRNVGGGWNAANIAVKKISGGNNQGTMELRTLGHSVSQLYLDEFGNVGIGMNTPRAGVDMGGYTDALVLPAGLDGDRPVTPVAGMVRYNSASEKFEGYQGGSWQNLIGGSVANLNDVGDVSVAAPNDADVLKFDSASQTWVAAAAGGATPAGADRQIQFNSANAFAADANFVYTSVGRLGIGTATPSYEVEVSGDVKADMFILPNPDAGYNAYWDIYGSNQSRMEGKLTGSDFYFIGGRGGASNSSDLMIAVGDNGDEDIVFSTGLTGADKNNETKYGNVRMRIYGSGGISMDGGTFYVSASGNAVGIGTTSPQAQLDVAGTGALLVPRGDTAQRPAGVNGMLRYNSASEKFEGHQGGFWTDIITSGSTPAAPDRGIQFNSGNSFFADANFLYNAAGDLIVGSTQKTDTGNAAHDKRMFFDKAKGAFRAGSVDSTQWNTVGDYSIALGRNAQATTWGSIAIGDDVTANGPANSVAIGVGATSSGTGSVALVGSTASGIFSAAMGTTTASGNYSTAIGREATVSGSHSMVVGLGNATGAAPVVSGASSYGIFMGDQSGYNLSSASTMALIGVTDLVLDADGSTPASKGCLRFNDTSDKLQFSHDCSSYSDLGGAGNPAGADRQIQFNSANAFAADANFVYTSTGDFIVGSYQTADTGNAAEDNRMFFDVSKGAFRTGEANSTQWDDANVGDWSFAGGLNSTASGNNSFAMGSSNTASNLSSTALGNSNTASGRWSVAAGVGNTAGPGDSTVALGYWNTASGGNATVLGYSATASGDLSVGIGTSVTSSGNNSTALGQYVVSSGQYSVALGMEAEAAGNHSMALGLGNQMGGANPKVSGAYSLGIFMGDQSDYDLSSANTMALVGLADLVLDADGSTPASKGCLRFNDTTDKLQFSHDCSSYSDLGGAGSPAGADRQIQFNSGNAFAADANFVYTSTGDFIVGSYQLDDTGTGSEDYRMFFDVSKGSFRSGIATGTQWDDANVGSWSTAIGYNTTASHDVSTAIGYNTTASGSGSTAMGQSSTASSDSSTAMGFSTLASGSVSTAIGRSTTASGTASTSMGWSTTASGDYSTAMGREVEVTATGDGSMGIGLTTGPVTTDPQVSGAYSFGIFMGDQSGYNLSSASTMALVGLADLVLDADGSTPASKGCLRFNDTTDKLQFSHDCSSYSDLGGAGSPAGADRQIQFNSGNAFAADANFVYTSTGDFIVGSYQTADTGNAAEDARMFFDKSKAAFRAGNVIGTQWDDGNVGSYSAAFGSDNIASGGYSFAFGRDSEATNWYSVAIGQSTIANGQWSIAMGQSALASGDDSVALGASNIASGQSAFALGNNTTASGDYSMAMGDGTTASGTDSIAMGMYTSAGNHAMAIGLTSAAPGVLPKVTGAQSLGIFMGNQSGYDLTSANTMALVGATDLVLDSDGSTPASKGCLRFNDTTDKLEYSHDCSSYSDFGSGSGGLWTDNTTHISYQSAFLIKQGNTMTTAGLEGNLGAAMVWYPDKKAFRTGFTDGSFWNETNIGDFSIGLGKNVTASGSRSFATGSATVASGYNATAIGYGGNASGMASVIIGDSNIASGDNSYAIGLNVEATTQGAWALGREVLSNGMHSMAMGLGNPSFANRPIVNGNSSFGIFMGDQTGVNLASANVMGLFGGEIMIDYSSATAGRGCIKYDEGTSKLQFSHDCATYSDMGAGGGALNDLSDAYTDYATDFNVFVGQSAGAGILAGGKRNTFVGLEAGNKTTTGDNNVFIGDSAGHENLTGSNNVMVGRDTGWEATGSSNVFMGYLAGNYSKSNKNVYIGLGAGSEVDGNPGADTFNTAVGFSAMDGSFGGSAMYNTIYGAQAGLVIGHGDDNVMLGYRAGDSITGGSRNILIGTSVDAPTATTNDYLNIGNSIYGDMSTGTLYVSGTGAFVLPGGTNAQRPGTPVGGMIRYNSTASPDKLEFYDAESTAWTQLGGGGGGLWTAGAGDDIYYNSGTPMVGIGQTNPDVTLDVTGDIEYTGTITDVSDMRLKTDIKPLEGSSLDKLAQVQGYSFRMKDDPEKKIEYGVMAQEVKKTFPELVKTAEDEMGTMSVNYVGFIAPLIEASKELHEENIALKAELETLKAKQTQERANVDAALDDLRKEVNGLKAHTGYGVNKAEIGLWLMLGMLGGMSFLFFIGGVLRYRSRQG